jgi:hypothetical protein
MDAVALRPPVAASCDDANDTPPNVDADKSHDMITWMPTKFAWTGQMLSRPALGWG